MKELLRDILEYPYFTEPGSVDGALHVSYEDGENSKLLVVTGSNASGKSFFVKFLAAYCRELHDLEVIRTGMASRTETGVHRAFMYGDEQSESTGDVSVHSIRGGIRTSKARTSDHLLVFDEPDIGLSEGYQGALGLLLAQFAGETPDKNRGTIIVTHSRRICRHLLPLKPMHLRFGEDKLMLKQVVATEPPDLSIEALETLRERGRTTYSKLQQIINDVRSQNRSNN